MYQIDKQIHYYVCPPIDALFSSVLLASLTACSSLAWTKKRTFKFFICDEQVFIQSLYTLNWKWVYIRKDIVKCFPWYSIGQNQLVNTGKILGFPTISKLLTVKYPRSPFDRYLYLTSPSLPAVLTYASPYSHFCPSKMHIYLNSFVISKHDTV